MNKNIIFKYLSLFSIGGLLYYFIEILLRGYSHWTMFILGGMCFIYAGIQNENTAWNYPLWKQLLKVDIFVLISEFISGCILNLWLNLNIWDYSNLKYNILGQSSLLFAFLFLPLCFIAIILDDYIRYWFFKEEKPIYKLL